MIDYGFSKVDGALAMIESEKLHRQTALNQEDKSLMTPSQFKAIRTNASLTQEGLAKLLRLSDSRSIRRYEDGSREISGPISLLMELLHDGILSVDRAA